MKIAFLGDLVLLDAAKTAIGESLKRRLESCDIKVLNFESPIHSKCCLPIHKSGPNIEQDIKSSQWVKDNGFNLVSLANNHILDSGVSTFYETVKSLDGIKLVGAGSLQEAYSATSFRVGDKKVAFIAGTHKEFGCHTELSGLNDIGAAWICSQQLVRTILEERTNNDLIFLLAHAGVEFMNIPLPEWKSFYRGLIDFGVDGIIASHPHVPQGIEFYKNKPIAYSLGNFIFQTNETEFPKYWNNGIILILDVEHNEISASHCPIYYDYTTGVVDLDDSKDAARHIEFLCDLLKDDTKYREELYASIANLAPYYSTMYSSTSYYKVAYDLEHLKRLAKAFFKRALKKYPDPIHAYNLFNCESHRWMMQHLLRNHLI